MIVWLFLALSSEGDFAKDGATQQDVDPGVEDLIPCGHPNACHHQGLIAGDVVLHGYCRRQPVGVDHDPEAKDLQTLNMANENTN